MILITGGAGYIGSQIVHQLQQRGESVIVLDNLSTGVAASVKQCKLVVGDVGDFDVLDNLLKNNDIKEVIHLAAATVVSESVANPAKFYVNNSANTAHLLAKCVEYGVEHFIFSSTAAVYGLPKTQPINEQVACQPINPYGHSKLISEEMLQQISQVGNLRHVILRYFNVAGADPAGHIGPFNPKSTLLIRMAVQTALGLHDYLSIYGNDYDTPDGTGVRDYIHVADISQAHIDALHYLRSGGKSVLLNCGYGHGYSVLQVIKAVEQVTGKKLPVKFMPRRAGDPDAVIADAVEIRKTLNWQPQYDDLVKIVADAYHWEQSLLTNPIIKEVN